MKRYREICSLLLAMLLLLGVFAACKSKPAPDEGGTEEETEAETAETETQPKSEITE